MITLEEVERSLPPQLKSKATPNLVKALNNLNTDPEHAETIRNNFISYSSVLRDGVFKLEDYLNAVAYVSFKMMGYNNKESYQRTFPQRYSALVARGATDKDISAYIAAYNKNKLVNLVLEQSLIPSWILNQDAYQKAINTQLDLMNNSQSDFVRTQAANSILTHLKRPETKQVELKIDTTASDGIAELKESMLRLAEKQKELIEMGAPTKTIAHEPIIIEAD